MKINLFETYSVAPVKKGNRWKVIVATPGQGSSGFYSEEVLRRDAEKIVPKGGQAFINHGADRNPKDMIGVFPEGSFWGEEEGAVVAELETFSHWASFVEEVGPHCGMSLYAAGDKDSEGNVQEIFEAPQNGCDLVARPGLVGSGIVEQIRESANNPEANPADGGEGNEEEMEKVEKAIADLTAIVQSLVADKTQKEAADAQVEADEAAIATAVESFASSVQVIEEADLFKTQKEALLEAAKSGQDITALVESAKAVKAEALKEAGSITEGVQGRVAGAPVYESATDLGKVLG